MAVSAGSVPGQRAGYDALLPAREDGDQRPFVQAARFQKAGVLVLALVCALGLAATVDRGFHRSRTPVQMGVRGSKLSELDAVPAAPAVAVSPVPAPAPAAAPEPAAASPFGLAGESVGDQKVYSGADEAFQALDKNGDGVLDAQDHGMLAPMSKAQFKQVVEVEEEEAQEEVILKDRKASGAISHIKVMMEQEKINETTNGKSTVVEESEMELNVDNMTLRLVDALYTFGAPGTANTPLYDATRERGCFKGLRIFTKTHRFSPGTGTLFAMVDPVSPITSGFHFNHAKMPAMAISALAAGTNVVQECGSQEPKFDNYWWVDGHGFYSKILQQHLRFISDEETNGVPTDELIGHKARSASADDVRNALVMASFTSMNYLRTQQIAEHRPMQGWNMVGRACSSKPEGVGEGFLGLQKDASTVFKDTMDTYTSECLDHIILFQNEETLECAMTFEGSDDALDWLSNLHVAGAEFCGFGKVHAGFRAKMLRMVGGIDFNQVIRSKLPKCSKVTITGHSLGAAQAELFAACANRDETIPNAQAMADKRIVSWPKGSAEKMPLFYEDQVPGVYLRNKGNGMCIDVKGTTTTNYFSHVIMFPCEMPDGEYQKDQLWEVTDSGFIINQRSGKCMDGDLSKSPDHETLVQWTCDKDATNSSQTWKLTEEGFIENLKTGLCANNMMQLFKCPFTDQKWKWLGDGFLQNRLTGMCLDVVGQKPVLGAHLTVWDCENTAAHAGKATDQQWDVTNDGALRNRASGLCLVVLNKPAGESKPDMVLGNCTSNKLWKWWMSPDGYLFNRKLGTCLGLEGEPGTKGSYVRVGPCQDQGIRSNGRWELFGKGFIKNEGIDADNGQYQCIEVLGDGGLGEGELKDGAPLGVVSCKVNTDQKWEVKDGYIRNVLGGRKCLDFRGDTPPMDHQMWIDNCYEPGSPWMFLDLKWEYDKETHRLQNSLYWMCMRTLENEEHIHLWPCDEDHEQLTLSPEGTIVQTSTNRCLSVEEHPGQVTDRKLLKLKACDPTLPTSQRWATTEHGFLVHMESRMCAGARRGGASLTAAGQPAEVVIGECPSPGTQLWQITPEGLIKNMLKGTCVSAVDSDEKAGIPIWNLETADCVPSEVYQQWEQVPGH